MRDYLYILIIAAVVTYLLTPMVRRASISIGALHAARSRDVHSEPTPLLGGVAMYAGLVAGLLIAERLRYLQQAFPSPRTVIGLLLAGGLLVLIGIIDDRWGMSAVSKLAGQIAAGGILVWSGAYLPWIPLPGGEPVEPVDEVHRVDRDDDDQDREREAQVRFKQERRAAGQRDPGQVRAAPHQDAARCDLPGQLAHRAQTPAVIDDPDEHEQAAGQQQPDDGAR